MAATRTSIAELLRSGTTLTASEAVAVARAALACEPPAAAGGTSSDELPLPDAIFIDADGTIACQGGTTAPTVANVALLLRSLLPSGRPGVPGGLCYAIARALREVDAPAFEGAEDFSSTLERFQTGDTPQIAQSMLARIEAGEKPASSVPVERRRPNSATISNLRHALREADSRLYEQQRSPDVSRPARRSRARRALTMAAGLAAAAALFAAGAATRGPGAGTPASPATGPARAVHAADIVLEASAPGTSPTTAARVRTANARPPRAGSPKHTRKRGAFARMHLEWLRKAFS